MDARRRCAYTFVLLQETTRRSAAAASRRRMGNGIVGPCMFSALLFAAAIHADPRVDRVLAHMTLEEKLGQLTQLVEDQLPNPLVGSILSSTGAAHINELQRGRKVPLLIGYDVIHGYRTIFPIPLAIASSWDPQLAELSARVAAREARSAGIRWTFAPMVDIARDARWGRIAEGAGED